MQARIYQPARSAMTSGLGNTRTWVLEFAPGEVPVIDPLMGWTGSGDTTSQVRLRFETAEAAEAYARDHGIAYRLEQPHRRGAQVRPLGYAGNFAHNRRGAWTH